MQAGVDKFQRQEDLSDGVGERPPPPPDPIYTFRPHAGEVTAVKYVALRSQGALASGTSSGQLSVWDLGTKRQLWVQNEGSQLTAINTIPGSRILSQCRNTVNVWNLETHQQEETLSIENPGFSRLSVLNSQAEGDHTPSAVDCACFAVAGSNPGKVNWYSISDGKLVLPLTVKEPKSKGMCMCVKVFCGGGGGVVHVLGGFEDGSVVLWDCRNGSTELAALKLYLEPVMCVDFDEHRLCGVGGSPLKTLEVFSLSSGQGQLQKNYSVELRNPGVADVGVRQDSKIMASGGWDGRIRVFGWKKGKPLAILNYHTATVHCVAFASPSALPSHVNILACGSKDERISLWRLY